jgi:hypothetical protein
MPRTSSQARSAIASGGEKLSELAWTVGRDRRKEARLQRRWSLLQIALGAAFALLARRLAERAWVVMTGEEPPILGHAGEPANELPGTNGGGETSTSAGDDATATGASAAPATDA